MRWLALVLVAALAACDNGGDTPDWSRMIDQPKLIPFEAPMRAEPDGVIARDYITDVRVRDGRDAAGVPIGALPVAIDRALLARGRDRFELVCATCHGVAGDGDSPVARAMERRRPPSLHEARLVALSAGELYRVIREGYGLMPRLGMLLDAHDRWAVVAYVETLQLAGAARLDALPPAIAADARRSLP